MARRRAHLGLLSVLALAAAWLVAPATVAGGDPCYHGFDLPARTTAASTQVDVLPCAFGPTNARIPVGGTVTFVNDSGWDHLITGANQAWGERDTVIAPGSTAAYTFRETGVYPYACALHRGMSGAILVGESAADAAAPVGPASDASGPAPIALAILVNGAALLGSGLAYAVARRRPPVARDVPAQPAPEPASR